MQSVAIMWRNFLSEPASCLSELSLYEQKPYGIQAGG
jgi:hypothetical protein